MEIFILLEWEPFLTQTNKPCGMWCTKVEVKRSCAYRVSRIKPSFTLELGTKAVSQLMGDAGTDEDRLPSRRMVASRAHEQPPRAGEALHLSVSVETYRQNTEKSCSLADLVGHVGGLQRRVQPRRAGARAPWRQRSNDRSDLSLPPTLSPKTVRHRNGLLKKAFTKVDDEIQFLIVGPQVDF